MDAGRPADTRRPVALAVAAAIASGGWAEVLGKRPADLLTADDQRRIVDYCLERIKADPSVWLLMSTPLTAAIVIQQLTETADALYRGLAPFIGRPIAEIPNDLGKIKDVSEGIPGFNGPASLLSDGLIGEVVAAAGSLATHGLLLAAILALILLGAWALFRGPAAIINPLAASGR